MLRLTEDSIRVVDGKLYRSDGMLMNKPCMLVYENRVISYGDLDKLDVTLLKIHSVFEKEGKNLEKLRLLICYSEYRNCNYDIHDVCYLIRRGSEDIGSEAFMGEVLRRWKSSEFWEWLQVEKKLYKVQTE